MFCDKSSSRIRLRLSHFLLLVYVSFENGSSSVVGAPLTGLSPRFDPYHHELVLGTHENFTLEWRVEWGKKLVSFNISGICKGYIGLGLSKNGEIENADFVIGGVDSNGRPFISDYHGLADGTLARDYKEDWILLNASRSGGRTHLNFSRKFDTCDENDEDIPINSDLLHLIWILFTDGRTDEVTLFTPHIGRHQVYLLDPDPSDQLALNYYRQIGPHSNLYLMQLWRISTRQRLLPQSSFRMCSIIKGRTLTLGHNILGGGAYIPHEAKDHVRQITLSRCVPPFGNNASQFFDPLVSDEGGEECTNPNSALTIPRQLCSEKIFVWGHGGRPFYFPEEVGIPIGDSRDEYFMLEIEYSNPEGRTDIEVKAGLDLLIHPGPRQVEAGLLTIGYDGQFVIPPRSNNFNIYGHCSPQCTKSALPNEGLVAFAALLQMRSTGRRARIRHFRGANELEWILNDGNYNSTFQQTRLLQNPVLILPGDQITVECTFDTSDRSTGTYSGALEDEEQCMAHLYVNQSVPVSWCSSSYSADLIKSRIGIQDFSRSLAASRRFSPISDPIRNLDTWASSIERGVQWTPDLQKTLQIEMSYGSQLSSCPLKEALVNPGAQKNPAFRRATPPTINRASLPNTFGNGSPVSLPDPETVPEYQKHDECHESFPQDKGSIGGGFGTPRNKLPVLGPISSVNPFQSDNSQQISTTPNPRAIISNRFSRIKG